MLLRRFKPGDIAACLDVFDSNVPVFFTLPERAEFESYLRNLPGPQWVVEYNRRVVGCAGWAVSAQRAHVANLCWGMVDRAWHRQGLGRELLRVRLRDIAQDTRIDAIEMNTSQHTFRFYEREGFAVVSIENDAFAPGLHRYDMNLDCTPSWRASCAGLMVSSTLPEVSDQG